MDGVPGTYATGVPIYRGGQVFLSPPDSARLLPAAGAHVLHADVPSGSRIRSWSARRPRNLTTLTDHPVGPRPRKGRPDQRHDSIVGSPVLRMSLNERIRRRARNPGRILGRHGPERGRRTLLEKTHPRGRPDRRLRLTYVSLADAAKPGLTLTLLRRSLARSGGRGRDRARRVPRRATFAVPSLSFVQVFATPVVLPVVAAVRPAPAPSSSGSIAAAIVLLDPRRTGGRAGAAARIPSVPVDEPAWSPSPACDKVSPTARPATVTATAVAATAVLPPLETPKDDFPLPSTADLAPLPEPEVSAPAEPDPEPEAEKPRCRAAVLDPVDCRRRRRCLRSIGTPLACCCLRSRGSHPAVPDDGARHGPDVARLITPGGGVDPGRSAPRRAPSGSSSRRPDCGSRRSETRCRRATSARCSRMLPITTPVAPTSSPGRPTGSSRAPTTGPRRNSVDVLASRSWSLAQLLAEQPPFEPARLIDLIRRQLPSCQA